MLRFTAEYAPAAELYRYKTKIDSTYLFHSKPELKNYHNTIHLSELSPIMFPSLPSSSPCALADGCAQLAQDLGLPTSLAALGIQVTLEDIRFTIYSRHFMTLMTKTAKYIAG